jgi:hypothetical protein
MKNEFPALFVLRQRRVAARTFPHTRGWGSDRPRRSGVSSRSAKNSYSGELSETAPDKGSGPFAPLTK